ncbi:MAG: cytochrome c biogenesis protein DipZ [Candidatus Omnitrophica bacterium]|nr:cytochrome c biogenesis protein DipZ [Candidatus Omnitrophota bacterium]
MIILLGFAFLAGFVTILAPCIWPLLPIVLSASSGGGKRRPLGITAGVITSFTIFTLSISYLEKILGVDPNLFRLVAVVIIVLLGLSMVIPSLGTTFENGINRLLGPLQNRFQKQGTGFFTGYVTGFSIGLVWAPCAGPILATIATLAATQAVDVKVILVTLAYVIGLGIPLFFFSLTGSVFFDRMRRLTKYTGRIQQVFGIAMIFAAILIYTNYDKNIQVKILNVFPSYGNFLSNIENNEKVAQELSALRGEKDIPRPTLPQENSEILPDLGIAPEFTGIERWLNTSIPLTMADLKGKVVLVDFWTYSCINCVRTLPYVTGWYEKYKDRNFVVVGVHTPEFSFEKETKNVEQALGQFKIHYPVAQDNDYRTWRSYRNRYWPAEYLIDVNGHIRKTHFGEGAYAEMEQAIRQLLREAGNVLDVDANLLEDQTPRYQRTPETYLGVDRMERFASNEKAIKVPQVFTSSDSIPQDHFAYQGAWEVLEEFARAQKGAALEIRFQADKVFLVIRPHALGDMMRVLIDGEVVENAMAGVDVKDGQVILDQERLYHLVDFKGKVGSHLLRLEFQNEGIEVYAFTFG